MQEGNIKNELDKIKKITRQKIKNDPRLTKVGKFLRRYSLDELPQLINIFSRDMNLVGPRPLPDYEVEKMEELVVKEIAIAQH